jgi:hypothetical protein
MSRKIDEQKEMMRSKSRASVATSRPFSPVDAQRYIYDNFGFDIDQELRKVEGPK